MPYPDAPGAGSRRYFREFAYRRWGEELEVLRRERPTEEEGRRAQFSFTVARREELDALSELFGAPRSAVINLALALLGREYRLYADEYADLFSMGCQLIAEYFFFEEGASFEDAVGLATSVGELFFPAREEFERQHLKRLSPKRRSERFRRKAREACRWLLDITRSFQAAPERHPPEDFPWEEAEREEKERPLLREESAEEEEAPRLGSGRRARVKVTPKSYAILDAVAERLGTSRAGAYQVALGKLAYDLGLTESPPAEAARS